MVSNARTSTTVMVGLALSTLALAGAHAADEKALLSTTAASGVVDKAPLKVKDATAVKGVTAGKATTKSLNPGDNQYPMGTIVPPRPPKKPGDLNGAAVLKGNSVGQ